MKMPFPPGGRIDAKMVGRGGGDVIYSPGEEKNDTVGTGRETIFPAKDTFASQVDERRGSSVSFAEGQYL